MIDPNLLLAARRLCVAHDALISSHPTGELRIEFFSARDAFSKELRKEFRANSPWLELYAAMRALISTLLTKQWGSDCSKRQNLRRIRQGAKTGVACEIFAGLECISLEE